MTRACIIKAESGAEAVDLDPNIEALQGIVGGYIERVRVPGHEAHAYVNEDGLRLRLSPNALASRLLGQPIVGDVVVFGSQDEPEEGDVPVLLLQEVAAR